jgi:hypothetical protein
VKRKGIKPPRYGAVGQHGSIAVVERLIRAAKHLVLTSLIRGVGFWRFCSNGDGRSVA